MLTDLSGSQSALEPAGEEAERLADLFWWMATGAVVVWLAMILLAFYSIKRRAEPLRTSRVRLLIVIGGAIIPTIVLMVLLVFGLAMLPPLLASAPEGSLKITVTGEQWWWRVQYQLPGTGEDRAVNLANEIRLPVGQAVQFQLQSPDVIHAFWIPSLGGKVDMIPGRVTRLALKPTRTGIFRGTCAEYCGTSHALMGFNVEVMEQEEFARWFQQQAAPAPQPLEPLAAHGQSLFLSSGCGACHTVRGPPSANGIIGPDLTHVGGRHGLGAGILNNDQEAFRRWLAHTDAIKPGVLMPSFGVLPEADLKAIAAYLEGLK